MEKYKHTQTGYVIIVAFATAMLLSAYFTIIDGAKWTAFSVIVFLGICLILCSSLTVVITEDLLKIKFGPGLIRKNLPLNEIASCQIVKNPWYYGWGIHLTRHGWLYNVSGFSAVEIATKTGKKYRIGTDAPEELENALKQSFKI